MVSSICVIRVALILLQLIMHSMLHVVGLVTVYAIRRHVRGFIHK
jgi:hypothetical protein